MSSEWDRNIILAPPPWIVDLPILMQGLTSKAIFILAP